MRKQLHGEFSRFIIALLLLGISFFSRFNLYGDYLVSSLAKFLSKRTCLLWPCSFHSLEEVFSIDPSAPIVNLSQRVSLKAFSSSCSVFTPLCWLTLSIESLYYISRFEKNKLEATRCDRCWTTPRVLKIARAYMSNHEWIIMRYFLPLFLR